MSFTQYKLREVVSGGNVGHHVKTKKATIWGIASTLLLVIGFLFSNINTYISQLDFLKKYSLLIIVVFIIGLFVAIVKLLRFDTKQELFVEVSDDHLIVKSKKYADRLDKKIIKAVLPYSKEGRSKSVIAPINTGMRIFFNNMAPNYEFTMNMEDLKTLIIDLEKRNYPVVNNLEKISKTQEMLKGNNSFTKKILLIFIIIAVILITISMAFVFYYDSIQ